eukprot:gene3578-3844_t
MKEQYTFLDDSVALIPGAMSFLLLNCEGIIVNSLLPRVFEQPLIPASWLAVSTTNTNGFMPACCITQLHDKQLVVFAVNDNPDVQEPAGGSHWSCLAYHRPSNSFRHYDSCKPHNRHVARALAGAASPLVRTRHQEQVDRSGGAPDSHEIKFPPFVEVQATPQQQNGHDCGVYVLAVAQALCEAISQGNVQADQGDHNAAAVGNWEQREKTILTSITPEVAVRLRQQISDDIRRLAAAAAAK